MTLGMTSQEKGKVRVRFAPSPTGFLHIGGVRVALYNWLYARQNQGQFLLRIEDTDLERSEQHYTDDILRSLEWLGLKWDEEPIFQSKRLGVYREKADHLVEQRKAYYCFCTESDVEAMRQKATQEGLKPQYDRTCRDRGKTPSAPDCEGKPYVIRVKIPLDGYVEFEDLIRGPIRFENKDLDDFVLIRSNGAPTYNLSVVVDDGDSQITHLLRGDDHINNTPKQMHLYHYLGYCMPQFAHLPMILGADKKKLSKRHGAVSANIYRAEGYLPEALLNFLARLGWSHGDQEIFTVEEMIRYFSFGHVQKSSAVFNVEKLLWTNGSHIRTTSAERLQEIVLHDFSHLFDEEIKKRVDSSLGLEVIRLIQPKVKLVKEIAEQLVFLCSPDLVVNFSGAKWTQDEAKKTIAKNAVRRCLETLAERMGQAKTVERKGKDAVWGGAPSLADLGLDHIGVDAALRQIAEEHGIKLGELAQPIRQAMTGGAASAGLFELLSILPWDVVVSRLQKVQEV